MYKLSLCNICELSNLCSLVEGLYHYIPSSLAFSLLHVCDPKAIDSVYYFQLKVPQGSMANEMSEMTIQCRFRSSGTGHEAENYVNKPSQKSIY